MTRSELEFVRRGMDRLSDPETAPEDQIKILRTISQIFEMDAQKIELEMVDSLVA